MATQIAAALAALPPGLTEADVLAAVAGRGVTLAEVATWTGRSQVAFALGSTGITVPTEPALLIARLGVHVAASFLSAAMLAAIPRNDGSSIVGGSQYYTVPIGANRGLYLAQTARHRLKVGTNIRGPISITLYRLVLGAA